jgi:hypothetical protein
MAIRYRCPDISCRKTFPWDTKDNPPSLCPHCGYSYREVADDVISMPNILSAKTKSIEGVARSVMDSSEARADMAAEMAGGMPADYSSLKITNMNDGRNSEFAVKDISNPVTEVMKATPNLTGFQQNGAAFAAATSVGPYARAGANIVTRLSTSHGQRAAATAAAGRVR